ncbi:HAD family hydrolase [Granulosicoccus antarcticus]|uniref:Phosphorylated carbohydrates phosphatase n=1 Tax=Granulosicoccus antarcticus IMCC3135 TaxID=1192854 RepID=A0A2Z2NR47_9GAMM|nr:HAD family phosphatase [Granulosicoccus antarcticus]ASJ71210.1 Phosphorylated carbohydrates phosphatase [Granulosicoccus antarcticus IMCC3135]
MKPIAAIFDMDGLLIDSETIALRTFQMICDQHQLGDQFSLYQQLLGTNDATTLIILSNHLPAAISVEAFMQDWMSLYEEQTLTAVPLMNGVLELLDYLEASGIPKSVATSTRTELAHSKLSNSGILHRFTHVTCGDQVDNGKPAPDIYLKAAQRLQVDPARCLALEDSPIGVTAALAAGMQVIQIPSLVQPDAETIALGHKILNDLHEVIHYLEGR